MARKPTRPPDPPDPTDIRKAKALALYIAGETQSAIAERLGVTRQTVSKWLGEAPAREALASTHARALERIEALKADAVETVAEVMRGEVPGVTAADRTRAAFGLLDRGGIVGGQRLEHSGLSGPLTLAELEARVRARMADQDGDGADGDDDDGDGAGRDDDDADAEGE